MQHQNDLLKPSMNARCVSMSQIGVETPPDKGTRARYQAGTACTEKQSDHLPAKKDYGQTMCVDSLCSVAREVIFGTVNHAIIVNCIDRGERRRTEIQRE